jgi:hypothetical protein
MEHFFTFLNLFGLGFDMVGVVILFYEKSDGLTEISKIVKQREIRFKTNNLQGDGSPNAELDLRHNIKNINEVFSSVISEINETVSEINSVIAQTNANNAKYKKKSQIWLVVIILGFLMQLAAAVQNLA